MPASPASQDPAAPLPHRLGCALAGAGPGITLAALAEVSAFALAGAAAPMPAVRAFGWAAALTVALDFMLQVCARGERRGGAVTHAVHRIG